MGQLSGYDIHPPLRAWLRFAPIARCHRTPSLVGNSQIDARCITKERKKRAMVNRLGQSEGVQVINVVRRDAQTETTIRLT